MLFGSHSENELSTENAMFVIPSVVEAVPHADQSLIGAALREYRSFSGNLRGVTPHYLTPPRQ